MSFDGNLEQAAKGGISEGDAKIAIENEQGFAGVFDEGVGEDAGLVEVALQNVNVVEAEDRAFDEIARVAVGADADGIPFSDARFAQFAIAGGHVLQGVARELFEISGFQIGADFAQGAAHVAGLKIQEFLGGRSETANAEVAVHDHQGDIDDIQHAGEILIGLEQLRIAVMEAIVEDAEFLIAGLQSSLGGFHLFVGGLQLFGGGLVFLRSDLIGMGEGLQFVGELCDLLHEKPIFAKHRGDFGGFEARGFRFARRRRYLQIFLKHDQKNLLAGRGDAGGAEISKLTERTPVGPWTGTFCLRTGLLSCFARGSVARMESEREWPAIFARSKVGAPGAGSRYGPRWPQMRRISRCSLMTTLAGR